MIILRNKTYSTKTAKAIYALRKSVAPFREKVALLGEKVLPIGKTQMKRGVIRSGIRQEFSKVGQARKTIQNDRAIKSVPTKLTEMANRGVREAKAIAINPGHAASKGIETAIKTPIAASGQVASVALPAVNPALAVVPVGTPSIAIEGVVRKNFPGYVQATERGVNAYRKSSAPKIVENGVNGVVQYFNYL